MSGRNVVVAGDYMGKSIITGFDTKKKFLIGLEIVMGFFKESIYINKDTVEEWEPYNKENPVVGVHRLAINFKDGKKSLIELDEKAYDWFLKAFF